MNEQRFKAERDSLLTRIRELNKVIASPRDRDTVLPNTGGSEVVSIRARLRRAENDLLEIDNFLGKDKLKSRVPWNLCVVVLDDIDRAVVDGPLAEAKAFWEANSRFKINETVIVNNQKHKYFSYLNDAGQTVWNMLKDELPAGLADSLPTAHSYIFLFKLYGKRPALGGSTMGVAHGIPKGGKSRPYATIATDTGQYNLNPYQGFLTQGAQLLVHEGDNCFNCVTGVAPYFCTIMKGIPGAPAAEYEAAWLKSLTDADYAKLLADPTW